MAGHGVPADRLFTLPLDPDSARAGESGVPEMVSNPDGPSARVYAELARTVATEVERRTLSAKLAAQMAAGGAAGTGAGRAATAGASPAGSSSAVYTSVKYDDARRAIVLRTFTEEGAREALLQPAAVRRACRCAACVDENTGEQRLRPESVSESVAPTRVEEQGNYAVAVTWSDGHASSIYTYDQLRGLAAATSSSEGSNA
jgi:ATP-binding protein involved in chromosome partitioning